MASTGYYCRRGFYYIGKGLLDPTLVFNYVLRGTTRATQLQVKRIAKKTKIQAEIVDQLYRSPVLDELRKHVVKTAEGTPFVGVGTAGYDIYVLLRLLKPETTIETGVEAGVSSSFLLQALADNNKGKLYSVDYRVNEGEHVENIHLGIIPVEVIPRTKRPVLSYQPALEIDGYSSPEKAATYYPVC